LDHRSRQKDTLTVIVADHGDGLGDHDFFGHAFVAYQELVHVPLILQWPGRIPESTRIDTPVSTRRVYHTMLDAAIRTPEQGKVADTLLDTETSTIRRLALRHTISGRDPEQQTAFSEVYPPLNFVKAIETRQPDLLTRFRCLATRRAVVRASRLEDGQPDQTALKLIAVDDLPDELFDLANDPFELDEIGDKNPVMVVGLTRQLEQMVQRVRREHESLPAGELVDLEGDDLLHRRLRGLGYLE
jgi:arylsulfatase A-like enzyme